MKFPVVVGLLEKTTRQQAKKKEQWCEVANAQPYGIGVGARIVKFRSKFFCIPQLWNGSELHCRLSPAIFFKKIIVWDNVCGSVC
jgi:hypothetical protein